MGTLAADSGGTDTVTGDPVLQATKESIAQRDWASAQSTLKKALAGNAQNADYHNLYAYSLRKSGRPT